MTKASSIVSLFALCALSVVALAACVTSPRSRTAAQSSLPVTVNGYTPASGQTVTIQAVNQNTGNLETLGTATSTPPGIPFSTPSGGHYKLYPWTYPAGVVAKKYWSPQAIVPDLATSQGHLELVVSLGSYVFRTFSEAAFDTAEANASDPLSATAQYSDGTSTVLLAQSGVGFAPETPWTNVQGMISNPPVPGPSPVAWSVGYYKVEGGKKIYGLICTPTTGGPHPVVVFNHGGTGGFNGGNVSGVVTASGWPSPPASAPDGLGQCVDWAKRGWVFATSSYRGENVNITSSSPAFATGTWTSDGYAEFCLGEVTDVLALTDLVMNHASAISVGGPGQMVPLNVSGQLLMYGYSHGGCITYRAVEQGAPVTAFAVAEGFTDIRLGYLIGLSDGAPAPCAAVGSGAYQPPVNPVNPCLSAAYYPDASGVMGYNWRSAHYFASRGDLAIQKFKTMPILILHGDVDYDPSLPPGFQYNPTPLAHAAEISADIGATNIFVGPGSVPAPSSEPCIDGPEGAPLPSTLTAPNKSCPITFTQMDKNDPCLSGSPPAYALPPAPVHCFALPLPLAAPPGQAQQQHYLVVYHGMNHVNGGFAIKNTFGAFVEHNFQTQPGCDGAEPDCASD